MMNLSFNKVSALREWLKNKSYECGNGEAFSEWLNQFFDNGNTITVHEEEYDFWACWELI